MRVTVIFGDATIFVDGVARRAALPPFDPNWHALQWDGDAGTIECKVGAPQFTTDATVVSPFIAAWQAAGPPSSPPLSLSERKAEKRDALMAFRYVREIAGLPLLGLRTDRESQALLTGAALAASLDAGYTVDWKTENGWVTLNAAQLLAAAQAVRAHVQACFSNERAHAEAIEALATAEAVQAYDVTTGWP